MLQVYPMAMNPYGGFQFALRDHRLVGWIFSGQHSGKSSDWVSVTSAWVRRDCRTHRSHHDCDRGHAGRRSLLHCPAAFRSPPLAGASFWRPLDGNRVASANRANHLWCGSGVCECAHDLLLDGIVVFAKRLLRGHLTVQPSRGKREKGCIVMEKPVPVSRIKTLAYYS